MKQFFKVNNIYWDIVKKRIVEIDENVYYVKRILC